MDYRDPIVVIDDTIENLVYLVEWWLEDLDIAVARDFDLLTREDAKTISALRATRRLLPRLRIVRSNYEGSPLLPDAQGFARDRAMDEFCERSRIQLRHLLNPPGEDSPPGT
ncbi:hypothetical protein [Peristeroidobacter soli]|jgi:hypothetical protein|uniref:hypothetical protein n=1 Tax=Peristeroidobacter soli TaxID=2497877 RepID=UPI00101C33E7|nr:hypothetical protein [Peristeroidobacter soli]